MHNWYGIETEAAFRRQEWQRMVAADARAALAYAGRAERNGRRWPHLFLARLRALGAPRLSFGSAPTPRRTAASLSK